MNRTTVMYTTFWLMLAASQSWLLYRLETLLSLAPQSMVITSLSEATTPIGEQDARYHRAALNPTYQTADEALKMSLKRIDSRLAALERSLAGNARSNAASTANVNEPSTRDRAIADQRLASMLPNGPLSREDIARFHADMQNLSPDERFATATALARAINEGRVQPAPGGF